VGDRLRERERCNRDKEMEKIAVMSNEKQDFMNMLPNDVLTFLLSIL